MGQKVNPTGIRLGITKDWTSKWYASTKDYANYLNIDLKVRDFLAKKLKGAAISRIQIERPARNARIAIYSARPGVIIGKKGGDVETLRKEVAHIMQVPVHITIEEVRKPDMEAKLVAENIAGQLERRIMFRRAMKRAIQTTMRHGALGVKVCLSGRLAGSEIARTETIREGRVPLHTFRADIDYGTATAHTTYGSIGIKVWIFKGETHLQPKEPPKKVAAEEDIEITEE
jgi:small subunit ribosomal protein S3